MSRRKTEAWFLVDLNDRVQVTIYDKRMAKRYDGLRCVPLMRRDPKAEAVVRAAVKWHQTRHEAGAHGGFNAELSELVTRDLKIAVHALQASQKKAKR